MATTDQRIAELEDRNRDLAGAVRVLSEAIRHIEGIADTNKYTVGGYGYDAILHVCRTGGVRTAMSSE